MSYNNLWDSDKEDRFGIKSRHHLILLLASATAFNLKNNQHYVGFAFVYRISYGLHPGLLGLLYQFLASLNLFSLQPFLLRFLPCVFVFILITLLVLLALLVLFCFLFCLLFFSFLSCSSFFVS